MSPFGRRVTYLHLCDINGRLFLILFQANFPCPNDHLVVHQIINEQMENDHNNRKYQYSCSIMAEKGHFEVARQNLRSDVTYDIIDASCNCIYTSMYQRYV